MLLLFGNEAQSKLVRISDKLTKSEPKLFGIVPTCLTSWNPLHCVFPVRVDLGMCFQAKLEHRSEEAENVNV